MKDPIERQAAIDVLKGLPTWWADAGGYYGGPQPQMEALLEPEDVISAIENMPSAQPEIVRCKDCKFANSLKIGIVCRNMSHSVTENDFCSRAERRTDELGDS